MTNSNSYDKIVLNYKFEFTGIRMGYIKKNGLLYTDDLHTVVGVDDTSSDFSGRVPFGAHRSDDDVFSD